jgi:hypothetical protein
MQKNRLKHKKGGQKNFKKMEMHSTNSNLLCFVIVKLKVGMFKLWEKMVPKSWR